MIKRILKYAGISRAVLFGALSKIWLAFGGAVTFVLIAYYFTPKLQGFYFTFSSLLSLGVFVELGLTTVIVVFTSHEWSKLSIDKNGRIVGDDNALSRLKSLAKLVFMWYLVGAVLLTSILSIVGYVFFSGSEHTGIDWILPWLFFCLTSGLSLAIVPAFALLEGSNQVAQIYFYRFIQEVVRSICVWFIIILGGGLWALVGSSFSMSVCAVIFLTIKYRNYFITLYHHKIRARIDWAREVWPMQWRMAVSFMSGYFFFPLFNPVIFHYKGAAEAGRIGMTLAMTMALMMIASMWLVTKVPQFGVLISKNQHKEVDSLLYHAGARSILVASCGTAVIMVFVSFMYAFGNPLSQRFLPPIPTAFFLAAAVLMQISIAQSTFLRAHKKEPFMLLSAVSAVIMTILTLFTASRWGSMGIAVSYFFIIAFLVLPYGTIIWLKCRKEWRDGDFIGPSVSIDGEVSI